MLILSLHPSPRLLLHPHQIWRWLSGSWGILDMRAEKHATTRLYIDNASAVVEQLTHAIALDTG